MKTFLSLVNSFFSFLSSLKLAVLIILSLAVLSAVGTIYESKYDAQYAQKMVYYAWPMHIVLSLLAVNLICVIIDRYPWKKHHLAFITAHIGILVMMLGFVLSGNFGVDGSMAFGIGEKNRYVTIGATELVLYSSFTGDRFTQLFRQDVEFLRNNPKKRPFEIPLPQHKLRITDYRHYSISQSKFEESTKPGAGPALRFQLKNPNVDFTQWIFAPKERGTAELNLGPAKILMSAESVPKPSGANEILIGPGPKPDTLKYEIHSARGLPVKRGVAQAGDLIETGWMGMTLRLLKFLPSAEEKQEFTHLEGPSPLAQPAVEVEFNGDKYWMALNSMLKLFSTDSVFALTFGNKRVDLGFDIHLKKFEIGRYQGTMRAASYQSLVDAPGRGEVLISMNEPMYYQGYTFYQASFQEDEAGRPIASILSVNYDPGRSLKYLGSLLIVIGALLLFYFRRAGAKLVAKAPSAAS